MKAECIGEIVNITLKLKTFPYHEMEETVRFEIVFFFSHRNSITRNQIK